MCDGKCQNTSIKVGESVNFNWNSTAYATAHDLVELPTKEAYDACDFTVKGILHMLQKPALVGTYTVDFKMAGTRWFSCSMAGHCASGQKLAVTAGKAPVPAPPTPPAPSSSHASKAKASFLAAAAAAAAALW